MNYRREIDGLRALAVLAVVFFHADIPGFSGGFAGVDVFLVISGYLIAGLILREADNGSFSLAGFYERRVRRILPALLAMLAGSLLAGWILLPSDFRSFGASLTAISLLLSNFLFERQSGYFGLTAETTPLLHTWSLAVEEQFYLVFPVLLLIARRWGATGMRLVLAGAALISFAYSVWAVGVNPAVGFYSPISRAWEFLAGAILASGVIRVPARRDMGDIAALTGMALLGLSFWRLDAAAPFPGIYAVPSVVGTVLILFGTQSNGSRAAQLLSTRPFVAIGTISYSLYLLHWPLIVFAGYYVVDDRMLAIVRVVMALLSILLAWLSWRFVELPFRKPRLWLSRRALFAAATSASLALALCGVAIFALNGLPGRFDPVVQHLADRGDPPDYGCTNRPIEKLQTDKKCWIGLPTVRPNFVLWGDSHAAVYVPALADLAKTYGVSGYDVTTFGCSPLFFPKPAEDATAIHNAQMAECRERNEQTIRLLMTLRPHAVVLAAHWDAYSGRKNDKHRIAMGTMENLAAFEAGLRAIRKLGIAVYVVLDVPQTAALSISQLARARVIGAAAGAEPLTTDYLRRNARMRTLALGLQHKNLVQVIEPATLLCGPQKCRMTEGDYPLYYDSNHLNARGARFVGAMFRPMLLEVAGAPHATN